MARNGIRRKWGVAVALLIVVMAAHVPCANFLMAAKLLSAVRHVAAGAFGRDLRVVQKTIHTSFRGAEIEATLYLPAGAPPTRGVILVPGISELGCYHPRMVALARFLADTGFLILTPDIIAFREFQITAEPIDEVLAWYKHVRMLEEGKNLKQLGLSGVSFSGTLALIAASRPEIRDSVGFVMGIGCYNDLHRLSGEWFRAAPAERAAEPYPTRFYAKWLMMLAARDLVPLESEREFLRRVLIALLLQTEIPKTLPGLSPEARRWYDLAIAPQTQCDEELALTIERFLTPHLFEKLDPRPSVPGIRCPVFLVHGNFDDLIPPEESRDLGRQVIGAEAHLLISPFLTHTHPLESPLSWTKRTSAGIDACAFFYKFARILR
jgi:pimeloyl-ACP methyl ester carboxylesterase